MDQTYLWHGHASIATCSGSSLQNFIRLQKNTAQTPRKVFPEAQDIPRHGSGDLLVNRFWSMMEFKEFDDQRAVQKAQWTFQKQIRCADAQWTLDNDSQSSAASLKKLKLEEAFY